MSKTRVICLGATALAGKDYFADIALELFAEKGLKAAKYSLASPLKKECDKFLKKYFNISAFTTNPDEKKFIRNYLVTVGGMHREQTEGTYFTNLFSQWLEVNQNLDYVIVPDVRYAFFPNDEVFFFKSIGAYIIHLTRRDEWDYIIDPSNPHEEENSPKVEKEANLKMIWNTVQNRSEAIEIVREKLKVIEEYFNE